MEMFDVKQSSLYQNFPGQWLGKQSNLEHFYHWNTFYRRNLHRFVQEYLGITLYPYQALLLYLMGIFSLIVVIAARAAAKSYLIAIYSCARCILYPGSSIVLTSGTRGQSKLIVTKKIRDELMANSPMLRREIRKITDSQNEVIVHFWNGSTIETVTCGPSARGHRSTVNVSEEAREINKKILDDVIGPFKFVRQVEFKKDPFYASDPQFNEEPGDIYISSSIEESHWLYKTACTAMDGMLNKKDSLFVAMDYAVTLKHGIRTRKQLITERKMIDPISWDIEYENLVLRSSAQAYFSYDLVKSNQVLPIGFYPRRNADVLSKIKNRHPFPKQPGEIRVVSCDIAAIDRPGNDNTCFTCLRLFPDSKEVNGQIVEGYKLQLPYLEGNPGKEIKKQALRIRQLEADFAADYIVLDVRNMGIAIYDQLARVLYDEERGVEYPPLKCMNDEVIANRIINPRADARVYCVTGSAKLNSEMAVELRAALVEHRLELLMQKDDAMDMLKRHMKDYAKCDSPEERFYYERPILETMLLVHELINLRYDRMENTGLIRIREQGKQCKDRYSSLAMGCLFAAKLARDMLNQEDTQSLLYAPLCATPLSV